MTGLPDPGEVFRGRYQKLTDDQKVELFKDRVTNPLNINDCETYWLNVMNNYSLWRSNSDFTKKFCKYADSQ